MINNNLARACFALCLLSAGALIWLWLAVLEFEREEERIHRASSTSYAGGNFNIAFQRCMENH